MAFPTAVNNQITDAVTDTTGAGNADASSLAAHYTALTQSVNALHQQATLAQQHLADLHGALTQAGVQLDTPAPAQAATATTVNPQITDAVTQANVKVLGEAPAMAMGNLFIATSQALSNAAHNAVDAQQQMNMTMQAATVQGITTLYSIDTASTGAAASKIYE
jgi:hypothetical protein